MDKTNRVIGGTGGTGSEDFKPGNGGNVNLDIMSGEAGELPPGAVRGKFEDAIDGKIRFLVGGVEFMRFDPDGHVYVKGEVTAHRPDIFQKFCEWLNHSLVEAHPGEPGKDVTV